MKIFIATILVVLSINSAYADSRHGGRHDGRHGGGHGDHGQWIGPALIGGFIGYALAMPRTVYIQPPPQPIVVVPEGNYTGPAPQPVYQEFVEYNASCNCYMHILRQIGWR